MSAHFESEPQTLMEHFFKDKRVHTPRIQHQGDIIDRCMCIDNGSSIANYYLNRRRREKLVVYVRVNDESKIEEKVDLIKEYCAQNEYQIVDILTEVSDHPSFGFKAALEELENADGLISVDLNQFVSSHGDRIRELRPLIHHFFCQGGKHLITINDGIDTGTNIGQQNAIESMCETKVGFET